MNRILFVAIPVMAMIAPPAFAQYRTDVPAVLSPAPQPTTDIAGITARFRNAYSAHGRPRMVIFWNRSFSGQLSTNYDRVVSGESQAQNNSTSLQEHDESETGSTTLTKSSGGSTASFERRRGVRVAGPNAAGEEDADDTTTWEAQSAFTDSLAGVPVRLVDRALVMRTSQDALKASNRENLQAIETKALLSKADLILETATHAEPGSPSGYVFKVTVRDIKSGEILIQFASRALPAEIGQVHYVPGSTGFVAVQPKLTVGMLGHELALETMERLSRAW